MSGSWLGLGSSVATLLMAVSGLAEAQTRVRLEAGAAKIGLEDQVQVQVVVEGPAEVLEAPRLAPLTNLRVVGGPSMSQQYSFVNGAASQSRTFTYVVQGEAPGAAHIGPVKVKLSSGEQSTAALTVEVVAGSVRPARPRQVDPFDEDPFASFFGRRQRRDPGPPPKLFVTAQASRLRVYEGEPLLLTYYIYTQVQVTDFQFKDAPQYTGFWSEEVEQAKGQISGEAVTHEGESFKRFKIGERLLFPTRAGTLTIPATSMRVGIARGSLFEPGSQAVERATAPLTVTAEALPTADGFAGAVGRFKVRASLDKSSLTFGEAATLRFEVSGSGNLKWIDAGPEVKVAGAKAFPPQVRSSLKPGASGLVGTKTWEYVLVPETAGTLEVPALPFAYFDAGSQQIVRAESEPLSLVVQPGAGGTAAAPALPGVVAAPRSTGTAGGLVLRSDLDVRLALLPRLATRTWLAMAIALLLAQTLVAFGPALLGRGTRTPGASARIRATLVELRKLERGGQSKEAAAGQIERALIDVFGAVDGDAGPPADERERVARELLAEVRFIRYAPQLGDYDDKLRELAQRAAAAVRRWA